MAWFVQLILAAAFLVASYLLQPKPKRNKGPQFEDPEDPTAEAGRPIPVLFGCKKITGLNVVAITDKTFRVASISA